MMLDPVFQLKKEVNLLKFTVADQVKKFQEKLQTKDSEIQNKNQVIQNCYQVIADLNQQLKLARARQFARSSETFVDPNAPVQERLFDEAELAALMGEVLEEAPVSSETSDTAETIEVAAHTKKINRGKRQVLPAHLERIETIYTLSSEELIGPNGEVFEPIGFETREELNVIPQEVNVLVHKQMKYAVKGLEELGIRMATAPAHILPKSLASPGLLAHIAQAKYQYHLPLYRQEQIWKELEVDLPRASPSRWMLKIGQKLQPLVDLLFKSIKATGYIHADETAVTILKNKNTGENAYKGFMWVYTNDEGSIYDFRNSRAGSHPLEMLNDFEGILQVDGYSGYNTISKNPKIIEVGCMAHLRRKFMDIKKADGPKVKMPVVDHVLKEIQALYKLESEAKENKLTQEAVYKIRQTESKPILEKLHKYLIDIKPKTPPKGLLGRAITYALNQWAYVIRYLDHGRVDIDNNAAERCVKPFAIGRKNWLFSGSTESAKASGNIFSLIESAKLHELKVFDYLKYVFEQLPMADTDEKLAALLPSQAKSHLPRIKKSEDINPT